MEPSASCSTAGYATVQSPVDAAAAGAVTNGVQHNTFTDLSVPLLVKPAAATTW